MFANSLSYCACHCILNSVVHLNVCGEQRTVLEITSIHTQFLLSFLTAHDAKLLSFLTWLDDFVPVLI